MPDRAHRPGGPLQLILGVLRIDGDQRNRGEVVSRKRPDAVEQEPLAERASRRPVEPSGTRLREALPGRAGLMLSLQRTVGNRAVTDLLQPRHDRLPRINSGPGSLAMGRPVDDGDMVVEDEANVALGTADRTEMANPPDRRTLDERTPRATTILRLQATNGNAATGPSPHEVTGSKRTPPGALQRHSITSGWFKKAVKFKLDDLKGDSDTSGSTIIARFLSVFSRGFLART
jgi:hypothetical protein